MQQQGLEPNVITYMAVSRACRTFRLLELAMYLFDGMQQYQLEPNGFTYTAVIQ